MQYQTARSFAVSLAFLLIMTRLPANGFTIRKTEKLQAVPDLDTGESSISEVKFDLPVERDEKLFHSNKTNQVINNVVIGINDSKNINTGLPKYNQITGKSIVKEEKQPETKRVPKITGLLNNITGIPYWKSNFKTNELNFTTKAISSTTPRNRISTTNVNSNNTITYNNTYLTITDLQQNQLINETNTNDTKLVTSFINTITDSYNNAITFMDRHDITASAITLKDENKNYEVQTIPKATTDDTNIKPDGLTERETQSTLQTYNNSFTVSLPSPTISTLTTISIEFSSESNHPTEPLNQINYDRTDLISFNTTERYLKKESQFLEENLTTEMQITHNNNNISEEYINTLEIPIAFSIPLEKATTNKPAPSTLLVDLNNEPLNNLSYATTLQKGTIITTTESTHSPKSLATDETIPNNKEIKAVKFEIFSSKRAGYLDNSETTTLKQHETTTEKHVNENIANKTNSFDAMYESEGSDGNVNEAIAYKNTITMESQSQLVEDAIKEELLIEKTLNENELIKSRQPPIKLGYTSSAMDDTLTTTELVNDNILSVKPINNDKRKDTALYAVSPNYRPLKKLDVQPSKPFLRDPDDNSWRNESISSLGIVFKAKNASKSFTEVLKNKTTELSNSVKLKDNNNSNMLDLRLRLEKIAEVRKSKKKRINKFGDTVYNDYDESSENTNVLKGDITSPMAPSQASYPITITTTTTSTTSFPLTTTKVQDQLSNDITKDKFDFLRNDITTPLTTVKTKKPYSLAEFYIAGDDYDSDYITLPKIDLKKFTVPFKNKGTFTTQHPEYYANRPLDWMSTKPIRIIHQPDRQPTVQYFPPTKKVTIPIAQDVNQKLNVNDYDDGFKNKVNLYAYNRAPNMIYDVSLTTEPSITTKKVEELNKLTTKPLLTTLYPNDGLNKNLYHRNPPSTTESPASPNEGNFNRAFYVIKHYKDFINDAAKDTEDEKLYLPFTKSPPQGVTTGNIIKSDARKELKPIGSFDYESQFRKDIVNRFVENFNENSDRFKVDFPIIYNNSVVHTKTEENGKVLASSSAFMKRLYETRASKANVKSCDFNCERMTVELSPAYELHYYVPDQEEKEVMQQTSAAPYHFTL